MEANGPLTSYPRHNSYSSGARPPAGFQPIQPMTQHNRFHQYSSDPTLLDDARDVADDVEESHGGGVGVARNALTGEEAPKTIILRSTREET